MDPTTRLGSAKIGSAPTEKDFTSGAVQKAVFLETIQHPATILPLGASAGVTTLILMGMVSVTPVTVAIPMVAALVGTGCWIYNFFIRGDKLSEGYIQNLRNKLEQSRIQEIKSLRTNCASAGFADGVKECGELRDAYQKLVDYLNQKSSGGQELDAARYGSLAKDIYREGIKLLQSALEAHKALESIDVDALKQEKDAWARQLKGRGVNAPTSAEAKGLQTKIDSHDRRNKVYDQHGDMLSQSMAQIEELEGALENSYIELVDLAQGRSLITPGESVSRLERAVQAAQKVEAQLRGDTSVEDKMYADVAKDKS